MCPPSSISTPTSPSPSPTTNPHPAPPPTDIIPPSPLATSTYHHVHQSLPPALLNHSLRVYLYALTLARRLHPRWATPARLPFLFATALFHDMGCATAHDGPQRFEVCGADAAVAHLRSFEPVANDHDDDDNDAIRQEVWTAIACHTSPGIAERISPLARLIRLAVLVDFDGFGEEGGSDGGKESGAVGVEERRGVEERFPRLGVEKVLGDVVVEQGLRQPGKAPRASWVGLLVRAKMEEPEWEGVNKAF